jgi:hypothetical protein
MKPDEHLICRACHSLTHVGPLPPAHKGAPTRPCCFCGTLQHDGLVYTAPPAQMPCGGRHGEEKR